MADISMGVLAEAMVEESKALEGVDGSVLRLPLLFLTGLGQRHAVRARKRAVSLLLTRHSLEGPKQCTQTTPSFYGGPSIPTAS